MHLSSATSTDLKIDADALIHIGIWTRVLRGPRVCLRATYMNRYISVREIDADALIHIGIWTRVLRGPRVCLRATYMNR